MECMTQNEEEVDKKLKHLDKLREHWLEQKGKGAEVLNR